MYAFKPEEDSPRVVPLERLTATQRSAWQELFDQAGASVHQSPEYAEAVRRASPDRSPYAILGTGTYGAFEVGGELATSILGPRPLLSAAPIGLADLPAFTAALTEQTAADLVYFPNVATSSFADCSDVSGGLVTWERLPSPYIDLAGLTASSLWERVCSRYGSRAERQRRRFESAGFEVRALADEEAVAAVSTVERKSWKAHAGQSMHQRDNQFALYSDLLRSGLAQIIAAFDGELPVAFRLDVRTGITVQCLKWSYDEAYRRYSPGFYLLTHALAANLPPGVDRIDLFGSPDLLKDLLADGTQPRIDVAWPAGDCAEALRAERESHDRRIQIARTSGRGVRTLYYQRIPA